MAFSDAERTDVRRFCGYPAHGVAGLLQNWRYYQMYGLLEYRMLHLSDAEEGVVRRYLISLVHLERAVVEAGGNLDTDEAGVWKHNPAEIRDRTGLFDDWRRRLCGFMGVAAGPALGGGGVALVV
ncbi:MAG: hypothetical protein P4K98_06260 [Bryobacteraceae bacterium]|nr:hypothetical protein [Bryobacteraceae bacterium]